MMRFADGTEVSAKDGRLHSVRNDDRSKSTKQQAKDNSVLGKKREPSSPCLQRVHGSENQCSGDTLGRGNDNRFGGKANSELATKAKELQNGAVLRIPTDDFAHNGPNNYETEKDSVTVPACSGYMGHGGSNATARKDQIAANNKELLDGGKATEKGSEEDWSNKDWNDFVNAVDITDTPNLQSYLTTKEIRHQATTRFADAIDACMLELRKTTDEILSEVVAPICNQLSEVLEDSEEEIIKTMISNHIRRHKLLELIHTVDAIWKKKYTKLVADIMGEEKIDETIGIDEKSLQWVKGKANPKGNVKAKENAEELPCGQEEILPAQNSSPKNNKYTETTIYGQDVNWEELVEYEPSRSRILSFLHYREKRNDARGNFGEAMDVVHAGLENEVQAILDMASNVFRQNTEACLVSEEEIEILVMENYVRRRNLREELENSARQAQERFASLLSRLG